MIVAAQKEMFAITFVREKKNLTLSELNPIKVFSYKIKNMINTKLPLVISRTCIPSGSCYSIKAMGGPEENNKWLKAPSIKIFKSLT